jgi:hypothetical protein
MVLLLLLLASDRCNTAALNIDAGFSLAGKPSFD